ncbi:thermonuclease family protein [Paenibacillus sp. IITD108]|uniref:thermonuclease family protein n=1 Tax=Paenibacillus sp. IITD108 TaxID=3116649 RepID=UPI002F42F4AE
MLLVSCNIESNKIQTDIERRSQTITEVLNEINSSQLENGVQESLDTLNKKIIESTTSVMKDIIEQKASNLPSDGLYVVKKVYDGDTIYIDVNGKREAVRLLCIDTPEIDKKDSFAKEARNFLREAIEGKSVHIEFGNGKEQTGRDAYDRLLGYIFVDGENINGLLVENGLARVAYVYAPDTKYVKEYRKLERIAKAEKLGIWSIPGYVSNKGYTR